MCVFGMSLFVPAKKNRNERTQVCKIWEDDDGTFDQDEFEQEMEMMQRKDDAYSERDMEHRKELYHCYDCGICR